MSTGGMGSPSRGHMPRTLDGGMRPLGLATPLPGSLFNLGMGTREPLLSACSSWPSADSCWTRSCCVWAAATWIHSELLSQTCSR